jgi:V/A-type H+-transporting ATPase subunit E
MTYENLITSMEESAEERIRETMKKAYKQAEETITHAEVKAEAIKKSYLENAARSIETERNKLMYDVKSKNKMDVIRIKDEMLQKAFLESRGKLADIREQSTYGHTLKKLIQEAIDELDGKEVRLHVDKRDEHLCKQILSEMNKNSEIEADLTCAGGLNVSTTDEKVIVFNTFETRLDKAKELLKFEIFSTIYGD